MNRHSRILAAAAVAVAILLASSAQAQTAPGDRTTDRFIRTKNYVFNRNIISHIVFRAATQGIEASALVFLTGRADPIYLDAAEGDQLRAALQHHAPEGRRGDERRGRLPPDRLRRLRRQARAELEAGAPRPVARLVREGPRR